MRIVPNLNDISECPNCESRGLIRTTNEFGRAFKQCPVCTEQIYENEYTLFEKEQYTVDCIDRIVDTTKNSFSKKQKTLNKMAEEHLEQERQSAKLIETKKAAKEGFIFEMREEISNLTWSIHDSKTQILIENIQNIFNRIIDYIEEN